MNYYYASDQKIINQKMHIQEPVGEKWTEEEEIFLEIDTNFEDCNMMLEGKEGIAIHNRVVSRLMRANETVTNTDK